MYWPLIKKAGHGYDIICVPTVSMPSSNCVVAMETV